MKPTLKIAGALIVLLVLALTLAPEAQAFRGRGAAFVVGAAVGSSKAAGAEADAEAAEQEAAAAKQQAAAAQQQLAAEKEKSAKAQQEAEAAKKQAAPAPPPVAAGAALPLGTVVAALPAGCTATPVGGVNYYYCGGNFYQAVFEGSTLKYVTTKPK
jgi:hypothetical protein